MSLEQVHTVVEPQVHRLIDTRLRGGWLMPVRTVWGVLILCFLALFLGSFPESFETFRTACSGLACTDVAGQLTTSDLQALQQFGFSATAYAYYWTALSVMSSVTWCIVAGILAWRKSNDWLVLLAALGLVAAGISTTTGNLLFSPSIWGTLVDCLYPIESLAILYLFTLFPNGRFVPRWSGLIPLIYIANLLCYLLFFRQLHLPYWSLYRNPVNAVSWFGCLAILTFMQVYRYLRVSTQIERQQTKWVAFSFIFFLIGSFGTTAVGNVLSIQQLGLLYLFIMTVFSFLALLVPLSIGIAILRYRLWDIDIIIRRTLVYALLTVCIVCIYAFTVAYLGALFRSNNFLISLIGAGLVAVLFHPLRELLQRAVSRLLYGQRDEPYAVISRLSQRLETTLTPDTILPTIVETVAQALKLPYVAVLIQHDGTPSVAASYGRSAGEPLTFPLVHQREALGELLLAPRSPGDTFSTADMRLLNQLTHQIALAVYSVRLTTELRESNEHLQAARERLVMAREEERRRLRRDLHDGLGPTLAALTLKIGAAHKLLFRDPATVDKLLLELNGEIESTVADIRRLVYNLRPPTLDDLGLLGSIRECIEQYKTMKDTAQGQSLQLEFVAPEQLPPLSAAVEVATYRIVQEALTNVVRHAQARACRVSLSLSERLSVEVVDDGTGISAEQPRGVGIRSMQERAAELGGTCVIESLPTGGTRVLCQLPLVKEK